MGALATTNIEASAGNEARASTRRLNMASISEQIPSGSRRTHGRRQRRRIVFVVALLIAWPFIAWAAARALIVLEELPHADVIVVLGGSSAYLERTRLAAQLFKEGRAPKIVLTNDNQQSGWSSEEQRNPLFVERAAAALQSAGVPPEKIEALQEPVESTHDEAVLLRRVATQRNLQAIIFVTSAYHSRRARWTLRHVFDGSGVQIGIATAPPGEETPTPGTWWLKGRGWELVPAEYLKLIYYLLAYR